MYVSRYLMFNAKTAHANIYISLLADSDSYNNTVYP